jgi:glutaminyl-tRNA synthetase
MTAHVVQPAAEPKKNAKAATRPKSKSPAEYRAEARARDGELAAAFAEAQELGLSEKDADVLTGDRPTASLLLEAAAQTGDAALVAKWMINDLPRALAGKQLGEVTTLDSKRFIEFVSLVKAGTLTTAAAKTVLAEMVATGASARDLAAAQASAPPIDVGSAVDAVISANPDKAAQYRAGKTGLLGFFVGQVMRSAPNADVQAVQQAVRDRLG